MSINEINEQNTSHDDFLKKMVSLSFPEELDSRGIIDFLKNQTDFLNKQLFHLTKQYEASKEEIRIRQSEYLDRNHLYNFILQENSQLKRDREEKEKKYVKLENEIKRIEEFHKTRYTLVLGDGKYNKMIIVQLIEQNENLMYRNQEKNNKILKLKEEHEETIKQLKEVHEETIKQLKGHEETIKQLKEVHEETIKQLKGHEETIKQFKEEHEETIKQLKVTRKSAKMSVEIKDKQLNYITNTLTNEIKSKAIHMDMITEKDKEILKLKVVHEETIKQLKEHEKTIKQLKGHEETIKQLKGHEETIKQLKVTLPCAKDTDDQKSLIPTNECQKIFRDNETKLNN